MKRGIFTDLGSWTTNRLLIDLRRQFAYSVGVSLLMIAPFSAMVIMPTDQVPHGMTASGLILLFALEICTWFSFIRTWRELKRRMPEEKGFQPCLGGYGSKLAEPQG
ncbi:MAG: hypothetical protein A2283_15825 [Lentisphaerae bacterium RIFOXYA12_FULL_48_11]|nr:MAG: hypothetical protein A2283_15825 [Lentisphaerae bacterium RIFOXYA12_FULL_48_11]